jgi:hypothetical protein
MKNFRDGRLEETILGREKRKTGRGKSCVAKREVRRTKLFENQKLLCNCFRFNPSRQKETSS